MTHLLSASFRQAPHGPCVAPRGDAHGGIFQWILRQLDISSSFCFFLSSGQVKQELQYFITTNNVNLTFFLLSVALIFK